MAKIGAGVGSAMGFADERSGHQGGAMTGSFSPACDRPETAPFGSAYDVPYVQSAERRSIEPHLDELIAAGRVEPWRRADSSRSEPMRVALGLSLRELALPLPKIRADFTTCSSRA